MNDWTNLNIDQIKDYLTLRGDLVLKSGQRALPEALNDLPLNTNNMDAWCSLWLDEKSKSKLIDAIQDIT